MNWGDAINAFQQGVVDGQENPCAILTAVQIHPCHHYATVWNYAVAPLILVWSKAAWDAFPPNLQNTILLLRVAPGAFPVRGVPLAARNARARRRGGRPPPGQSSPSCSPARSVCPFRRKSLQQTAAWCTLKQTSDRKGHTALQGSLAVRNTMDRAMVHMERLERQNEEIIGLLKEIAGKNRTPEPPPPPYSEPAARSPQGSGAPSAGGLDR